MQLQGEDMRAWCLERDLLERLVALAREHADEAVPSQELDAVLAGAGHGPPRVPWPRSGSGA